MMWRCFKCETFNNGQQCFICGTDKNTPPPRVPVTAYNPGGYKSPVYNTPERNSYSIPSREEESKAWIPILVILGIIIAILLMVIFSSI